MSRWNTCWVQNPRPEWAQITTKSGKSAATSSTSIGSQNRIFAPGKTDDPTCTMTGIRHSLVEARAEGVVGELRGQSEPFGDPAIARSDMDLTVDDH
jgi:hypothetical protein